MDENRKRLIAMRNAIEPAERALFSKNICCAIINSSEYKAAGSVMCYYAVGSEADLSVLIAHAMQSDKRVLLPRCNTADTTITPCVFDGRLVPGAYGIPEPVGEAAEPDLIVCPMLAFNGQRFRIGYGAGYYDRLLAGSRAVFFGAAFAQQYREFEPKPHDAALHRIYTQEEIF